MALLGHRDAYGNIFYETTTKSEAKKLNPLPPDQHDENLLAHGIVRDSEDDLTFAFTERQAMNKLPDSILQSALYGRLLAAGLSTASAVLLALDQAQAALAAGLAIVAAAAAAASKVREWLRARQ